MSNNHISSNEFATLCQSQIALLSQSLGAIWSVVYLTEEVSEDGQSQLFPFAIYPQAQAHKFFELPAIQLSKILQALQSHSIAQLLPDNLTSNSQSNSTDSWKTKSAETKQLILPLIHQETLIGLLVTGREEREWQPNELEQVEEIARTIAIARFIEFQYHWAQDELVMEQNLRRIEHDRLDNLLHQLRNPLTALQTFGKLLLKRMLADDPNSKLAQSMMLQSDRFGALLKQFEAEATKLPIVNPQVSPATNSVPLLETREHGVDQSSFLLPSSPNEFDAVDLSRILDSLLTTAQAIATERNIQLINQLPPTIPEVKADLAAVRETLNNLIDNALKYTPAGGVVQLDLVTTENRSMLGIAIQDTGCGIPLQDQKQIFERHFRGVQAQGNIPGTGLGLAIAQELIIKMQGKIELISPNNLAGNNPGTTFIVWLRVSRDN
ncbi:MAG: GAF domain-containing sensor histidine kinase [Cyanobacteria bacterium P01_A01_bin.40]